MGIFKKSDRSSTNPVNTTIIASGTKIEGKIEVGCRVHVDGEFSGPINSKGIITIGRDGVIEGHIAAEKLIVSGSFSGTADCEEIHILSSGRVIGQMVSKVFVIDRGGVFDGYNRPKETRLKVIDRCLDRNYPITMRTASDNLAGILETSKMIKTG